MRRTRILYFVGSFEQGGSERQVAELVSHLPRDRFEAHVAVCNARDDYGYALSVSSMTDLRAPAGPGLRSLYALAALVRRLEPDIVHAVHDPQNSHARVAVRLAGTRTAVVGSLRCTRLSPRTLRRERLTRRWGRALIVNSRAIRDELEERGRIPGAFVVENGVDGARFAPLDPNTRARARQRFGMTAATFVVPGRIAEQKNQLSVVRAVAELRASRDWPAGAKVILAGRVEAHSPYAEVVDRAIASLGVGGLVSRIGPVRDAESLLGAADATLLPSSYEGMPNAVLESLACGTPAVVSAAANTDALVHDGVTGLVASSSSTSDVASAMRRFLDTTPLERSAFGDAGRRDVLSRFGVARMVDATCAVYERARA